MHINDIFKRDKTTLSFEFFPPKTNTASETLFRTITELAPHEPSFVSVTYGAGGSTRELTHDLVLRLKKDTTLDPIPHLTCVCHRKEEIRTILRRYVETGVSNILALGGDIPRGSSDEHLLRKDFRHAADLVRFIRAFSESEEHPDKRGFGIGVAGFPEGHPATPNRLLEMDYLKAKVDAGADYIVTQLFFDNHDFFDFRERCELAGIRVPIIAGIMPVSSLSGLRRMAELSGGTRFPSKLLKALKLCGEDAEAVGQMGIHYAAEQCLDLLQNEVKGIHFYTLNKSDATVQIYSRLNLKSRRMPVGRF